MLTSRFITNQPRWFRANRVQHIWPDSEKNRGCLRVGIGFVGRSQDEEGPGCPPWERQHRRDQGEDLCPSGLTCAEYDRHLWQIRSSWGSTHLRHLSDGLGSCFVHGFGKWALSCLRENLLYLFVISRPKVWLSIVEVIEELCPPEVVDGHDKG